MRFTKENWRHLIPVLPAIIFIAAIGIIIFWNKGTLEIQADKDYYVYIEDISDTSQNGNFKIRLKPGTYTVKLENSKYLPIEETITINRARKTKLIPKFEFIPTISKIPSFPKFSFETNPDLNIIYTNSDEVLLYQPDLIGKELINLPENTFSVHFSKYAKHAILSSLTNLSSDEIKTYWYNLDSDEITEIPFSFDQISWSPSGTRVLFYDYDEDRGQGELWIYPLEDNDSDQDIFNNGSLITVFKDFEELNISWSPDESKLAVIPIRYDSRGDLFIVDIKLEQKSKLLDQGFFTDARWSPDGNKLLLQRVENFYTWNPDIWIYDFESNEDKLLLENIHLSRTVWSEDSQHFTYIARQFYTEAFPEIQDFKDLVENVEISTDAFFDGHEATDTFFRYSIPKDKVTLLLQTTPKDQINVQEMRHTDPSTIRFYSYREQGLEPTLGIDDGEYYQPPEHVDWYELKLGTPLLASP